ncbi:MAG TPA: hypothetical protein VGS17_02950 [Candidatus Limnocylindria bacterium]|nr:hypothetical protein [Candidatus Limnocylindria bacterium]
MFASLDKWIRAFAGLDIAKAASSFYVGSGPFNAAMFASSFDDFSSSLASAVVATPAGSGGSGFFRRRALRWRWRWRWRWRGRGQLVSGPDPRALAAKVSEPPSPRAHHFAALPQLSTAPVLSTLRDVRPGRALLVPAEPSQRRCSA